MLEGQKYRGVAGVADLLLLELALATEEVDQLAIEVRGAAHRLPRCRRIAVGVVDALQRAVAVSRQGQLHAEGKKESTDELTTFFTKATKVVSRRGRTPLTVMVTVSVLMGLLGMLWL